MADHLNHLYLVHKATTKPEQTAEVLKFFDWAYKMVKSQRTGLRNAAGKRG